MENFHEYRSVWEHGELMERLRHIRHVALDMDGTIYMGMSLFPCADSANRASATRS